MIRSCISHLFNLELQDDSVDIFVVAFVNNFFSTGGLPNLDLVNVSSFHGLIVLAHRLELVSSDACGYETALVT